MKQLFLIIALVFAGLQANAATYSAGGGGKKFDANFIGSVAGNGAGIFSHQIAVVPSGKMLEVHAVQFGGTNSSGGSCLPTASGAKTFSLSLSSASNYLADFYTAPCPARFDNVATGTTIVNSGTFHPPTVLILGPGTYFLRHNLTGGDYSISLMGTMYTQ